VFAFSDHDPARNTADLTVWTAATGARALAQRSFLEGESASLHAATADGKYILYAADTNQAGDATDLWLAQSDGGGAKKLFAQVPCDQTCTPAVTGAGGWFVVSPCQPGDGGAAVRSTFAVEAASPAARAPPSAPAAPRGRAPGSPPAAASTSSAAPAALRRPGARSRSAPAPPPPAPATSG